MSANCSHDCQKSSEFAFERLVASGSRRTTLMMSVRSTLTGDSAAESDAGWMWNPLS